MKGTVLAITWLRSPIVVVVGVNACGLCLSHGAREEEGRKEGRLEAAKRLTWARFKINTMQ